ncbi:protein EcsB [Ligilactobacillus salivarius]|uniref:Bacterial ABC transporter protein EcsB n=2 Tax=Ligilactobacillus salivarius TaxID=1624 RepID=C2EEH1_9LACO|nr:ABC transporter permease [Ligilactobacillus salivarius]ATP37674.1 protein EcsB [Ligilactobacillus salivarius]EEJ74903.1 bacterial ABC transporter protein EcsB [Ligilactobacillus salivarius DSM 20555 = ATCC 11741]KRM70366.1 ABC superfamily ATP binding cassette transporter, membrane protein [Ligilactobacillus salivarius DSM 20555 = ATCC 11741]MBE7937548.1 ABC transporter permease [Ligilactobacillus salivarius]MDG9756116.1 ABC transporter permease [Ligilactobacillus salivarius]
MNNLWKKRLNLYLKRMIKYYRYVFNDHFVIALLFLLGGISYTYSNFIKSLNVDLSYPWAKPVVIIVLLVMLQFGKVGTLIDEPDKVFLLPQEKGMREYLMRAQKRAWVSNSVIQIVVWIVLLPFIYYGVHLNLVESIILLLSQVALKVAQVNLFFIRAFEAKYQAGKYSLIFNYVVPLIVYMLGLYASIYFALGITVGLILYLKSLPKNKIIQWNYLIDVEKLRLMRKYSFFNLFTDVPQVKKKAKRRKYLDWLIPKFKNVYGYLFIRAIIRNGEYSGLYIRLTVIEFIVLLFIPKFWLSLVIGMLFIYLIGFQMLPLYKYFDDNVFVHLYPLETNSKGKEFKSILLALLIINALISVIAVYIAIQNILLSGAFLALVLVESILFVYGYANLRLEKS